MSRRDMWVYKHSLEAVPPNHKLLADSGYVGVCDDLLVCHHSGATTPGEIARNAALDYVRSIAENGIAALESAFRCLTQPHHVHWAAQPVIATNCVFLYNRIKTLEHGFFADYRFDYLFDYS